MGEAGLSTRTDYSLPITQARLADAMGLTSVHVNLTLRALRRDRIVRMEQRNVHIEDWGRLAELADFDPEFLLIERLSEAA